MRWIQQLFGNTVNDVVSPTRGLLESHSRQWRRIPHGRDRLLLNGSRASGALLNGSRVSGALLNGSRASGALLNGSRASGALLCRGRKGLFAE